MIIDLLISLQLNNCELIIMNYGLIKYTIFETKWGCFGLAGTECGLLRTCLPGLERGKVKSYLLKDLSFVSRKSSGENRATMVEFDRTLFRYDKALFKVLREQITAYFEGAYVNFNKDIPIILDWLNQFARSVLTACRDIRFGETISYAGLAEKLGRADTARAVGSALAKNPLPLIIPCHRVVRSDGKIGGFSAMGGSDFKAKMLQQERNLRLECSLS